MPAAATLPSVPSPTPRSSNLWVSGRRRLATAIGRMTRRVRIESPWLEGLMSRLEPTLSLAHVRAEVVSIVDETHDTKSYWLRPNARFGTHKAGGYVTLHLTIDGRPVRRSYSLSSPPRADGLISITVKRVPGGLVSNWLAERLQPGDVLELSAPAGQFVLPATVPDGLLMLSAGSGITPVMSMLRDLTMRGSQCQVVFIHFARSPRDIIFQRELTEIAALNPHVRLVLCVEHAEAADAWSGDLGRFSQELLCRHAPQFRELDTYMCGPAGFMEAVIRCFESADADLSRLRYERFDVALDLTKFLNHAQVLRFVRSGVETVSNRPRTILEEAERAGVEVESGCRAGNCGACRNKKKSGVVVDVVTGEESSDGEEEIYLCVSVARGTVEVEL